MLKLLKKHLKSHKGDMYIQMLICMGCLIGLLAFAFQVTETLTEKVWLDNQINYISREIAITGQTSNEQIDEYVAEIVERLGGTLEIVPDSWFNEASHKVQLNTPVKIIYYNEEFPVINLGNHVIGIEVNLTRHAISEVYYKPE